MVTQAAAGLQRLKDVLQSLEGPRRFLVLFLLGALASFALAPFGLVPIMFAVFPCLVLMLDANLSAAPLRARLRRGFVTGWWFGFGYFVAGLWWLGVAVLKDAAHFAWALPFAVFGLQSVLAVFYGSATAAAALVPRSGFFRIVVLSVAFALAEWLRGHVASGFPWNALAYTAVPIPLFMQIVRLTGIYILSGFAVFVFAVPALAFSGKREKYPGFALALILVCFDIGYGLHSLSREREPEGRSVIFRLVQPTFDDHLWRTPDGRSSVFSTLVALSSEPAEVPGEAPDVIVWPESILPFLLEERPDARTVIGEMLKPGQVLVFGAAKFAARTPDGWPKFYNAVYALDDQGETISIAGKAHLVPFGEYLPFENSLRSLGFDTLSSLAGSYIPAPNRQMLLLPGGLRLFPLVCYEAIFPRLIRGQASDADVLINLTYDTWFGKTPGPYQHFAQARLRAVEAGKPMIRVGENGVSAMISASGHILERLPFDERGLSDVKLTLQ